MDIEFRYYMTYAIATRAGFSIDIAIGRNASSDIKL